MDKIILYHGSVDAVITPEFGKGNDKHDYGRGFYLTEDAELAREWASCRPINTVGYVHKYELDTEGLRILDFQDYDILCWLAELMKHRDASDSKRYRMLAKKFVNRYGIDTSGYDVIKGWRANASYFFIAKQFVNDNVDVELLPELLSLGGLGIQYCIKSKEAYGHLRENTEDCTIIDGVEYNRKYNIRDAEAREKMHSLIESDLNTVTNVFSTLL